MSKTIRKIISFVCMIVMVMSMSVVGVSAETAELDATVDLITFADPSQDKLVVSVDPDDSDEWVMVTITNQDGRAVEIFQENVEAVNEFEFPLSRVIAGTDVKVNVSTAPSDKSKTFVRKYYSFSQQQQAIDDLMDPSLGITQQIADVISLELDGDFGLINSAGIAFMKEQLAIEFEGQTTIDVQTFINALNEKICISVLSSKDVSTIKYYMERELTELGIDTLTEYSWYNELASDDARITTVLTPLAKGTYTSVTAFVDAFKAENFMNKLSSVHSSNVVTFLSTHAGNQAYNGSSLNLDWATYNSLQEGQKEYFAGLLAGVRYETLAEFETAFAAKLLTAAAYTEEQTTPESNPEQSLGTVPGAGYGGTGGGAGGGVGGGIGGGAAGTPAVTPGTSSGTFKDLGGVSWATEAIEALYKKGVINGVGGESFEPEGIVTKEQFVKIIAGTFDIKSNGEVKSFSDVPAGQWYTEFINAAVENGIINGVSDTSFGLGTNISRQDMAVIVYRVAQKYGISLEAVRTDEPADMNGIADYAKEAVTALYQAGVINGVGDGRFAPADTATRAQAAKIIYELWRMM